MSDLQPATANPAPFRIEPLNTLDQFSQCVELEEAVWGYDPSDMVPRRLFLLASRIGGQVLGAYLNAGREEIMAGFAMALPAYRNGHAYLHSHMLAVLPQHRNHGLGRALKLAQRDDALARGIDLMEWTFDPLEIKNAHLNIARLGAIVRRYQHNLYGPSSSPLQGGLPTDRVYAEWWLRSDRVEHTLRGEFPQFDIAAHVDVPAEIYQWKASPDHRAAAHELQARNAATLESAFACGLSILGYNCNQRGDGRYLLGHWKEHHCY